MPSQLSQRSFLARSSGCCGANQKKSCVPFSPLAIFPRGATTADARRQLNDRVNAIICKYADNKQVFFMDIGSKFLAEDGTLTHEIMPDLLHPHEKGYGIWAQAIEPMVKKLLDEK